MRSSRKCKKKVDQYYNFNQLLIKKQEETTGNMNKMVQEYERRIADMSEALKNSELKIEELTEIVRTSQEALIVNSNNNSNTKNNYNNNLNMSPSNDSRAKYDELKEMLMFEKRRAADLENENLELNHIINEMMKHKDHFDELIQKKENEIMALKQQALAGAKEKSQCSEGSLKSQIQKKIKSPGTNQRNAEEINMLQTNNQYLQVEVKKLKSDVNNLKLKNSELFQSNQRFNAEVVKVKEEKDLILKSLRSENDKLNKMISLLQEQIINEKQRSNKSDEKSIQSDITTSFKKNQVQPGYTENSIDF